MMVSEQELNREPMEWVLDDRIDNVGIDPATGDLILYDALVARNINRNAVGTLRRYNEKKGV